MQQVFCSYLCAYIQPHTENGCLLLLANEGKFKKTLREYQENTWSGPF